MDEVFSLASGSETRMPNGFLFGNYEQADAGTGCTVLINPAGATGGVAVRGGAPATRETDLLDPSNMVQVVHAVVLSGGSAFGLDASSGVMRWLEEKGIGLKFAGHCIPIVTGACIFDLTVGEPGIRPDADWGYQACSNADTSISTGNVGAGTGATVGKMLGPNLAMKAGLGAASIAVSDLVVTAFVSVNAAGNVFSGSRGRMVAGARDPERPLSILDPYQALFAQIQAAAAEKDNPLLTEGDSAAQSSGAGQAAQAGSETTPEDEQAAARTNTTIGCILTNAQLTKAQATRVASMAHDGFARAIEPVHTSNDGDTIFVMGSNEVQTSPDIVGILAARVMEAAIVNAALDAEGAYGLPANRDLQIR
ncbi:MAG: P1 family peptidase [Coriobacteriia bacterium]|nr:P1 family peptidase [Coriobacteriia bacterium]